MTEMFKRVNQG